MAPILRSLLKFRASLQWTLRRCSRHTKLLECSFWVVRLRAYLDPVLFTITSSLASPPARMLTIENCLHKQAARTQQITNSRNSHHDKSESFAIDRNSLHSSASNRISAKQFRWNATLLHTVRDKYFWGAYFHINLLVFCIHLLQYFNHRRVAAEKLIE